MSDTKREQESVEDVIRDVRDFIERLHKDASARMTKGSDPRPSLLGRFAESLLNRFEAAYRREKEAAD